MSRRKYTETFNKMYKDFIAKTKMFNSELKTNKIATRSQYYNNVYYSLYCNGCVPDNGIIK